MKNLYNLWQSKVVRYTATRYFVFALQFINVIWVGHLLGPEIMGVYAKFLLVLQITGQINFGLNHSASTLLATKNVAKSEMTLVESSLLFLIVLIGLVVGFSYLFMSYSGISFVHELKPWSFFVSSGILLTILNQGLLVKYRILGSTFVIGVSQSSTILMTLLVCLLSLVYDVKVDWFIIANVVALLISSVVMIANYSFTSRFKLELRVMKDLIRIGYYLFVYNLSFYFVVLVVRYFAAHSFSLKDFGIFSFAFSLGTIGNALMQAVTFLFHPKILHVFSKNAGANAQFELKRLREVYLFVYMFVSILIFVFAYIILAVMNAYSSGTLILLFTTIGYLIYGFSFGSAAYLTACGGERRLAMVSFISLVACIALCIIIISVTQNINFLMIPLLVSNLTFVIFIEGSAMKRISPQTNGFFKLLKSSFPANYFFPMFVFGIGGMLGYMIISSFLSIALMFLINHKLLKSVKSIIGSLVSEKSLQIITNE